MLSLLEICYHYWKEVVVSEHSSVWSMIEVKGSRICFFYFDNPMVDFSANFGLFNCCLLIRVFVFRHCMEQATLVELCLLSRRKKRKRWKETKPLFKRVNLYNVS